MLYQYTPGSLRNGDELFRNKALLNIFFLIEDLPKSVNLVLLSDNLMMSVWNCYDLYKSRWILLCLINHPVHTVALMVSDRADTILMACMDGLIAGPLAGRNKYVMLWLLLARPEDNTIWIHQSILLCISCRLNTCWIHITSNHHNHHPASTSMVYVSFTNHTRTIRETRRPSH